MLYLIWPFLVYWLILFVACYVVTEFAQKYLYDETTPMVGLKVAGGSAILAAVLVWTRTSYDTMFTEDIGRTVIQAIVWFAVFTVVLQFQPTHGAAIGIATMVLLAGMATLGVDSLTGSNRIAAVDENRPVAKPLRRPSGGGLVPPGALKPATDAAPATDAGKAP